MEEKNLSQPGLIRLTRHSRYEIRIKNKLLIKNCLIGRQSQKNNKKKYSIVKQFKTQTMQTKYDIKNER
jgi:hypothetical protein